MGSFGKWVPFAALYRSFHSFCQAHALTPVDENDPAHRRELWRSDGTEAGTYRLTDVCSGRCSSSPASALFFGESTFAPLTNALLFISEEYGSPSRTT